MSQQQLLIDITLALDGAAVGYMLTGSIVSSLQGEPRATHDIDFVVNLKESDISKLVALFPDPRYYLDPEAAAAAIKEKSMFNLIDTETGDKADFWILTDEPFDTSRFSRQRQEEFAGVKLTVPTPEDTILMKLKWARISGGSEKQFLDAVRVYEVQYGVLDLGYLETWIIRLDLADLWTRLKTEAIPLD
jgi:hypothetical protein